MKIINFETIKEKVNKLDAMAKTDMTKPNSIFPQKEDKSVAERMQKFLCKKLQFFIALSAVACGQILPCFFRHGRIDKGTFVVLQKRQYRKL